ncbi:MAG: hydrogenase maturation nickel metallochaperone HypA [Tepidanaerobacteraceae bacterium]|nr:hydrogenase maturation nickel metallochaperone HypA [Tepidanaerobacter sp.]HQA59849.1 hydrogenase maturation nickel metallochaperone HypA [Tepidanaerobacteraceae bacterium]HQE06448.1 hydrogenase maturation nickel metallochaperone HypA [Tepidanaerobacteraceae bacterium]
MKLLHELSITSDILDLVLCELAKKGYNKVIKIDITIGDLSGIVREHIKYYFELLSRATPAAGATLTINYKKSKFRCESCKIIYESCDFSFLCPVCKSRGTLVESCASIYINSIEVE